MELKLYVCGHCGNIVMKLKDSGVPVVCCGEPMKELVAGTTDGALEKHVPVWKEEDGVVYVTVGSVEHPMLPEHFIEFIVLQTKDGVQVKKLEPGDEPKASFALKAGDEAVAVYEYCNLHGLWKA